MELCLYLRNSSKHRFYISQLIYLRKFNFYGSVLENSGLSLAVERCDRCDDIAF
jgi:hypothetical protein